MRHNTVRYNTNHRSVTRSLSRVEIVERAITMNIPQTGRHPLPMYDEEAHALLKKKHRDDNFDPFATDPNPEVRRLGRLCLRRPNPNDYFALADMCARLTFTSNENRLLIFYAGKTLMALRRADQASRTLEDHELVRSVTEAFVQWVMELAQHYPSRRNLAVALWITADRDDNPGMGDDAKASGPRGPHVTDPVGVLDLLEAYRDQLPDSIDSEDETHAYFLTPDDGEDSSPNLVIRHDFVSSDLNTSASMRTGRDRAPEDASSLGASALGDTLTNTNVLDDGTVAGASVTLNPFGTLTDMSQTLAADLLTDADLMSRETGIYIAVDETQAERSLSERSEYFPPHAQLEPDSHQGGIRRQDNRPPSHLVGDEFKIGERIEDTYEVVDVRWGGMGVVYLCYDHAQREPVAIKSFQSRFLNNDRAVSRFTNEALTWIRLEKHRHIVQARLVRQIKGRPHIILEHVSGPEGMGSDLRSWIDHRKLDLPQAILFGIHIALGMQHATKLMPSLVHRDLKPANILVTHEGIAKVTDFGLVRSLDFEDMSAQEAFDPAATLSPDDESVSPGEQFTRVGAIVGTVPYMAPEQCQSKLVDTRADIYAFGIVLYEMLTGRHVFNKARKYPDMLRAHVHEQPQFEGRHQRRLPGRLQRLTLGCLEKEPTHRPQTWAEIVDTLLSLYVEVTGSALSLEDLEITGPELEARELMDKGYSLTELNRLDEALDAYDRAITQQPDYAFAWARKGRTLRLLERYPDALNCYNRALQIQPAYAWAWNGKGVILERMGLLEDALKCFETATELNNTDVWYWYNRANALHSLGRYAESIPFLERGLQIDPSHANSWAKLGQIYRFLQRYEDAVKAYEHAIRLDPTYAWAHNGCGLALKALGRLLDALVAFKLAARYQPKAVLHWYNVTETLVDLGQYEDAVQYAEESTRTDPNHAFSWAKLGQVMRHIKRFDEALHAYSRALDLEPNSAWAWNGKGIVLEQMERYEEALECYQRATELKPNDLWHWFNQGNVLVQMGRYEDSIEPLMRATRINRLHANTWARLGHAQRMLNRPDESLAACLQATQIAPAQPWAWNELGATYEVLGRYEEALRAYERAAELALNEPYYTYKQTDLLMQLGYNQRASEMLAQSVKLEPENSQLWAKYGQTLRRLNRWQEALEAYSRAVNLDPDNDWAWSGRGLALSALKRHDEALGCFERALEVKPSDVWYWYNRADELLALNRLAESLDTLEKALEVNPRHAESYAKRGQILRRCNDHDGSLANYDRAIAINPRYAWAWNGRGLTLKEMGRREESLASYERAAREESSNVLYVVNQIDVLLEMHRRTEALTVVDKAIDLAPSSSSIWARRGQVLRRLKRYEDSVDSYTRALELDPNYAWAWNGKGLCLFALARYQEALACYQQAVQFDDCDPWFWYNLGETMLRLGDKSSAVDAFKHALEIDADHKPSRDKLNGL